MAKRTRTILSKIYFASYLPRRRPTITIHPHLAEYLCMLPSTMATITIPDCRDIVHGAQPQANRSLIQRGQV
jgi:hypothetical protein